ncbi:MAG: c-type cytochrome, partial [Anaerolineales bacterium]
MRSISRNILVAIAGLAILSILVSACASGSEGPAAQVAEPSEGEHEEEGEEHQEEEGDEHGEDEHSPDEHMAGAHDVPDEAAAVPNPFADDEDSLAAGAELYASHCAVCHGETGEGDGPAASGLEIAPADLHEGHVQELSDGALFYIISHGKPETPMPAWED